MENPDIINTNEQCDSPVYVASHVNSPVNSPVFVSKESESEYVSSTKFTEKLILPSLNDDDTLLSATVTAPTTSPNNVKNVEDKIVSVNTTIASSLPDTNSVEHVSALATASETTTEMVTIVIKDFKYCQEEFLKQIKENNLSINP